MYISAWEQRGSRIKPPFSRDAVESLWEVVAVSFALLIVS